jgi:tetratricopeptide (TPR) repeat protein
MAVGALYLVHKYQMKRNIAALLDDATIAEQGGDLAKTQEDLETYLAARRDDGETWGRYARLLDQRDPAGRAREHVFLIYETAVRQAPEDRALRLRAAELALSLNRPSEARSHLARLWPEAPRDPQAPGSLAQVAEMLARCALAESDTAPSPNSATPSAATSGYGDDELLQQLPQQTAEKWYDEAIKSDPQRITAYAGKADRLFASKDKEQIANARAVLNQMIVANPDDPAAYVARYSLFKEWAQNGDPSDARRALEDARRALELAPDNADALQVAADALVSEAKTGEARELLQKAEAGAPNDPRFPILLSRLEIDQGNRRVAIDVLRRALDRLPTTEILLPSLLAEALIDEGQIEGAGGAREALRELRERSSGSGCVPYLEGRLAMRQGRWAEAEKPLTRAAAQLASNPQAASSVALALAECHAQLNHPSDRLAVLKAASSRPGLPAKVAYAQALADAGRLQDAIQEQLGLVADRPQSQVDAARLMIEQQRRLPPERRNWTEVDQRIAEAEKVLPAGNLELVLLRADALVAREKLDLAATLLETEHRRTPDVPRLALALARVLQRQDKTDAAIAIVDETEKTAGPRLELEMGRLGLAAGKGGESTRLALEAAFDARDRLPQRDRQKLLTSIANASYRSGERELARKAWEELARLFPAEPQYLLDLATLASDAGDEPRLRQILERLRPIDQKDQTLTRVTEAAYILAQAQRGKPIDQKGLEALADDLEAARPNWWGAALLRAQLAEANGQTEAAVAQYQKAIDQGNSQPAFLNRLLALLYQQRRFDEIDALAARLEKQGIGAGNLRLESALNLIRKKESIEKGLAAARQILRPDDPSNGNGADHLLFGRILLTAGKPKEAEAALKRAIELSPTSPAAWSTYVQLLMQTRQTDKARQVVQAAQAKLTIERFPLAVAAMYATTEDPKTAATLFDAALEKRGASDLGTLAAAAAFYADQQNAEKADPLFERLIAAKSAPETLVSWAKWTKSVLAARTGRNSTAAWQEALAEIERNLQSNPRNYNDQAARASLLATRTSRRAESIQVLQDLQKNNALGDPQKFLLAMLYAAEGRDPECEATIRELLDRRDPRHLVFYLGYLIRKNRLDEADPTLRQLKEVDPENPVCLEAEGDLLKLRNKDPELRALLLKAAETRPAQLGQIAGLCARYGFAAEAESLYRRFAQADPKQPERWLPLVAFLSDQDRPDEALKVIESIRNRVPGEFATGMALSIFSSPKATPDQKQRVESWLEEEIAKKPDMLELSAKLALIRIDENRFEEADAINRRILAAAPDNVEALNNQAWFLALRGASDSRPDPAAIAEARAMIDRAIDVAGGQPGLLDTRAVVLIRAGQPALALKDLTHAQALATTKPILALHLAWAYHAAGRSDEARKALEHATELGLRIEKTDLLERPHAEALLRDLGATTSK